jgi:hypothetical protein
LDGVVDGSDFGAWNGNKFTSTAAWCSGDFNADGNVDGSDFGIWNSNKFQSSDAATVPEPGIGWMWLLATCCALRARPWCAYPNARPGDLFRLTNAPGMAK